MKNILEAKKYIDLSDRFIGFGRDRKPTLAGQHQNIVISDMPFNMVVNDASLMGPHLRKGVL